MVGILQRPKSTSDKFAEAFGNIGQEIPNQIGEIQKSRQLKQEDETLKKLTGHDVTGLSPDLKKIFVQNMMKQQAKGGQDLSMASNAINEMEQMVSQSGIGMMGNLLNFSPDARFNRGKFEALQSSLMPLFKSMFPRGMTEKEFKFVNEKYIPQAGDTEQTILGKIDGLKRLMQTQGSQSASPQSQMMEEPQMGSSGNIQKFDLNNPSHKARRDQILKKSGGDRKKAEQVLRKEFEL